MSMQIADNFSYQGTKPLDARIKYATVADMKAVAESSLYDGCMAYVTGVKKYYTYDSTNTVDSTTGKWREYKSGSGHTVEDASGTAMADQPNLQFKGLNVTNDTTNNATVVDGSGKAKSTAVAPEFDPADTYAEGDRVMYQDELYVFNTAHTGAWAAADADKSDVDSEIPDKLTSQQMQEIKDAFVIDNPRNGYPVLFDETGAEHFVGWYKYADGTKKPVYQKIFIDDHTPSSSSRVYDDFKNLSELNIDTIIYINGLVSEKTTSKIKFMNFADSDGPFAFVYDKNTKYLQILSTNNNIQLQVIAVIRYTKTTDTPQ